LESIDEAWRAELMERINELTDITGIHINPDDGLLNNPEDMQK